MYWIPTYTFKRAGKPLTKINSGDEWIQVYSTILLTAYKFTLYFCINWPPPYSYIEIIPGPNSTRAKTFLDPPRTMVSSGNGPLPRCVIGVQPKWRRQRPAHIGGQCRLALFCCQPLASSYSAIVSTMGFCVTDFFGHILINNVSMTMH